MYDILYEDDRIRLRKGKQEDARYVQELLNDWDIMVYYGESDNTLESAKAEIDWFNSLFESNAGRWVIEDKLSGKYIGDIGVFDYHEKHRKGEIGYKLAKPYWGKGIMSKCLQAVIDIAFSEWNYNRIEAIADVRNLGCKALLCKNGFLKEGTMRDYEYEHGDFVDLELYAILKKDWELQKIHQCELEYAKSFSKAEIGKGYVCLDDIFIPDMYSHNFTYIHNHVDNESALQIIAKELRRRQLKDDFLSIHTNNIIDSTDKLKELGLSWDCELIYYRMQGVVATKLQCRDDVVIKKLDRTLIDEALQFDLAMNGDELGAKFVKDRFNRRVKVYLSEGCVDCYVALIDNQIIGHVDLFIQGQTAKIEDFDVLPSFQRQGIGRCLLKEMSMKALESNATIIYLVTDASDKAKHMYEKCGMTSVGNTYEYFFGFKDNV